MAPYEKRIVELLKVGKDKRALKVAKKKVREVAAMRCDAKGGGTRSPRASSEVFTTVL